MSEEKEVQVQEEPDMPQITQAAHASASLGVTIMVAGKSAWPKFEFSDNALPEESAEELIERVNQMTLEGAFNMAEKARWLMTELNNNK